MDNILVPTDFSGISDSAVRAAMSLADNRDCNLIFLHLISVDETEEKESITAHHFEKKVMKEVKVTSTRLEDYINFSTDCRVQGFKAIHLENNFENLVDYINKNDVYVVVMGSHGAKGFHELIHGSNSQKIVRYSPVPVMVIKPGYVPSAFKKLVFLSEFNERDVTGFERICDLAERFDMKIDLLTISLPNKFIRNRRHYSKMNAFKDLKPDLIDEMRLFNSFSIEEGINEYFRLFKADAIGMVTHKRRRITRWVNPSLTEQLINHMRWPILTVHNAE